MSAPVHPDIRLKIQLLAYHANLATFAEEHAGEYVVMQGGTVLGFYPTFEAALDAGYAAYGPEKPFLAQQILLHPQPEYMPI